MNCLVRMNQIYLMFLSCMVIQAQEDYFEEQIIKNEIEMAGLELRDDCENYAKTYKSALISNTFNERIKVREAHGHLMKLLAESLRKFEDEITPELTRNWTIFTKPGDTLLTDHDWSTLVSYDVGNDELIHTSTVHCQNVNQNCVFIKKGYDKLLETAKNETLLAKSWSAWQRLLSVRKEQFPNIVNLINKAATENEIVEARSYWDMLVDQEGAYTTAESLWDHIRPLYFKLQNFVRKRLFRFYNITNEDSEIPVYLLGSNFGYDWSYIANILVPHPELYYKSEAYIKKKTVKDLYKLAEKNTQDVSLGPLGNKFWTNSLFNMTFCENHLITDCVSEQTALLTCDKTSWVSYLDAFEVAIDVTLRNMNYIALPQMNLRYSVIDEAIKNLGSILAVKNMRYNEVWDNSLFTDNTTNSRANEMTELLLIALRVLPKLPYYLAADKWRLQLLENGFDSMTEKWWELRREFQGVTGETNTETDFLADPYMTSNKPYVGKFLGTVLMFQLLSYYKNNWQGPNENIASHFAIDENFLTMLRERSSTEWPSLISNYYAIYELNADAILDYFAPLNDYLENAPLDQLKTSTAPTTNFSDSNGKVSFAPEVSHNESHAKSLLADVKKKSNLTTIPEEFDPPLHPRHEHVEENLEGPNPTMEHISMYVGITLLVAVAAIIVYVIISKEMKKRNRTNNRNRRYEK